MFSGCTVTSSLGKGSLGTSEVDRDAVGSMGGSY